jgi:hypothetical protein
MNIDSTTIRSYHRFGSRQNTGGNGGMRAFVFNTRFKLLNVCFAYKKSPAQSAGDFFCVSI